MRHSRGAMLLLMVRGGNRRLIENMKIIGKIFLATLVCLPPAVVLAATGLGEAGTKLGNLKTQGVGLSSNLGGITASVLSGGFYLLGTIFLALMIYGGFVWGKAAGRDEEVTRARKIITTSLIGMIILLASYGITNFILSRAGTTPADTGPVITCAGLRGSCIDTGTDCPVQTLSSPEATGCASGEYCCVPK